MVGGTNVLRLQIVILANALDSRVAVRIDIGSGE